jgi:long-chain acyl-CoA synthetase
MTEERVQNLPDEGEFDPAAIEKAILKISPLVKEIAVIEHEGHPFALIFPDFEEAKARSIVNIENEIKWYAVELYNIKAGARMKVRGYRIVTHPLSKTASGEPDRSRIAALLHESESAATEAEPDDALYQTLKRYLERFASAPVRPSSHIELDLGLDSLEKVELMTFIEETFGCSMDEKRFASRMTVEELYGYIRQNSSKMEPRDVSWGEILREKRPFKLIRSPFTMLLFKRIFLPLFRLYFRLKITGEEKLPDAPFIIAPSHQSFLDGFIIEAALPDGVLKKTFFLVFEQMFSKVFMRPIARYGQSILINVNDKLKASLQSSAQPLKEGSNLVVFPEGARSRDRELLEFKRFFAILAKELDLPIVPVLLDGTFEALHAGMIFPRPREVVVRFLDPVYPDGQSYEELTARVKDAIRKEMQKHPLHRS